MKKSTQKSPKKKKPAKKAKVIKKPRSIVMVSPVDPQMRFIVASEFADDALIERELMGDVLPTFIYQFENDGKVVTGLTVRGVNEVVRRLGKNPKSGSKIRINPMYKTVEEVEREGEKGIEVSVFGEDLVTGNSAWGIKFEPYFKTSIDKDTRKEKRYANKFAVEKALSKAERNAKRKLIAEGAAAAIITKLIAENGGAHVQKIDAPKYIATTMKPATPVASTPEALYTVIENAIRDSKTVDAVIDLGERIEANTILSVEQKAKLQEVVKARLDVMQQ